MSELKQYRNKLTTIWFVGAGLLFTFLFLQTLRGVYPTEAIRVWKWFLPTIAPSLSIIVCVKVIDARTTGRSKGPKVEIGLYRLTKYLSIFYFALIAMTLVYLPFQRTRENSSIVEFLNTSHLWLGTTQTLVTATLAVFFFKPQKQTSG